MKTLVSLGLILVLTAHARAAVDLENDLPDWVLPSTKIIAVDLFVKLMQGDKFYRINKFEAHKKTLESGQPAIEANITFEDVSGCKDRHSIVACTPVGEQLLCFPTISDCQGRMDKRRVEIFNQDVL